MRDWPGHVFKVAVYPQHGYTTAQIVNVFLEVGLAPTFCFRHMYRQNTVLVELLAPVVRALGYELLGIEQTSSGRYSLLRIYIDNETGIRLEDCERVSEQVNGILDVNDPIKGAYNLEISSPGFDRPLFTLEHFRRFIGQVARLTLQQKVAGHRKITGVITAVNDDSIEISMDDELYTVATGNIDKARLVPAEN